MQHCVMLGFQACVHSLNTVKVVRYCVSVGVNESVLYNVGADMAALEAEVRAIHKDGLLWGACECP